MEDSILVATKKLLGIAADYSAFDDDLLIHINSVFSDMQQLGAHPTTDFAVDYGVGKWSDFFGTVTTANLARSYMYLRVKLLFDPPATSFAIDSMQKMIDKMEWRLSLLEFDFSPLPVEEVPLDE